MNSTLPRLLTELASTESQTILARFPPDQSLSALACVREMTLIAAALRQMGVRRGDTVALVMEPGLAYLSASLAVLAIGAVVIPCHRDLDPAELVHRLDFGRCRICLCGEFGDFNQVMKVAGQVVGVQQVGLLDPNMNEALFHANQGQSEILNREALLRLGHRLLETNPAVIETEIKLGKLDDTALICFIPDGDGDYHGIMLSHDAIVAALRNLALVKGERLTWSVAWGVAGHQSWILPWLGLVGVGIYAGVDGGASLAAEVGVGPASLWQERAAALRVASRSGSGPRRLIVAVFLGLSGLGLIRYIGERLIFAHLRSMAGLCQRYVLVVDFGLSAKDRRLLVGAGVAIRQLWGPNGCAGFLTVDGKAMSGVELRVVDSNGVDQPGNTPGIVIARGPQIMKGYFRQPLKTRDVLDREGWLHTETQARRGEDGGLQFLTGLNTGA